jgi:hypothetical protein
MFGLCALQGLRRSARRVAASFGGCVRVRNCASPGTIQRSIELLYYRTSVPSNERLDREANVSATVAERGGRVRAIRNHSSCDARSANMQPNPRTSKPVPRTSAPGEGRPNHLRLVADHGRVIDPAFIPREAARPAGPVLKREAGDAPRRAGAAPRREARVAGRRPVRLTRRGRLVVTSTIVLLVAVASMVLASAAQAAGHP